MQVYVWKCNNLNMYGRVDTTGKAYETTTMRQIHHICTQVHHIRAEEYLIFEYFELISKQKLSASPSIAMR